MSIIIVDGLVVDSETGEVLTPEYEVVELTPPTTKEKKFYRDTATPPHECTDPEQLEAFRKAMCDMRGVKMQSSLTWFKKENDYNVRTKKHKSVISNTQYQKLRKLIKCVSYYNIILCERELLCKHLGVSNANLARTLATVSDWIQVHPAKVGFIKIFITPMFAYKGRGGMRVANRVYYQKESVDLTQPLPTYPTPDTGFTEKQWESIDKFVENLKATLGKRESTQFSREDYNYTPDEFEREWLESMKGG